MAEGSEPSFGWLVLTRAWFGAWAFFDSWKRDLVVFVVSFAAGEATYYRLHGLPATWRDGLDNLIHLAAPVVIIWLLLFAWHLWLAPSALAYEAARKAATTKAAPPSEPKQVAPVPAINWAIWKQRSSYNLKEFAAILAKFEPTSDRDPPEKASYLRLITQDAMSRRLHVTPNNLAESHQTPDLWPECFDVPKAAAVAWAEGKTFDVTHIK